MTAARNAAIIVAYLAVLGYLLRRVRRRPWQVVTAAGLEARPERVALAWTEAGAWRKARRIWRRNPGRYGRYYCGNLHPAFLPSLGWFEVRPAADRRTMFEVLSEEANRAR